MAAVLYTSYFATFDGTSVTLGDLVNASTTITPSSGTGNSGAILGDVAADAFKTGDSFASYTFLGTVSFPGGQQGFAASYAAGTTVYDLVYLVKGTPAPTKAGSFAADQPSAPVTQWNVTTATIGCFMAGTMVATPHGPVAIETLKRGDTVLTMHNAAEPVRWVGRRVVSRYFADPMRLLPVRVRAGALGDALPLRDILVSPCHALLIDGVLVQAGALVNALSIVREEGAPATFTYYHIELASHALVMIEGVPAETFIDNVDRMAFDNWDEHVADGPDGAPPLEMDYPRVKAARQVSRATRERIAAQAAAFGVAAAA